MTTIYDLLRERIKSNEPVALATVVDGPNVGAKLIVTTTGEPVGDLGHPELTRIVVAVDPGVEVGEFRRGEADGGGDRLAMNKDARMLARLETIRAGWRRFDIIPKDVVVADLQGP